jgi:tetratricopeptide (TPR) repeat protein
VCSSDLDRIEALKYALSLYPHDDGHYLAVRGELLGLGVAPSDLISQGPPDVSAKRGERGAAPPRGGPDAETAARAAQLCGEAQRLEAAADAEGAAAAYMAALELDPANMGAIHSVAELHSAAGAPAKAQALYSGMAERLCAAARPDLALQCLDRADELAPGSTKALRLTLADALSQPPLLPHPQPHHGVATAELPDFEPGDFADGRGGGPPAPPPPGQGGQDDGAVEEGAGDGLHQALYSIDFQLDYGSPIDAKAEAERALLRYPGDGELLGRLSAADEKLAGRPHRAERAGQPEQAGQAERAEPGAPGLLAFPAVLDPSAAAPQATDETNDDTGAFAKVHTADEIYHAFKDEVAQLVGQEDYDTCYNLGIGYREMGLIGPAIEEFKKAMRDPWRRLECCSMIAMCEEARGDAGAAMEWLRKGIEDKGFPATDSAGMRRELALLVERAGAAGG